MFVGHSVAIALGWTLSRDARLPEVAEDVGVEVRTGEGTN